MQAMKVLRVYAGGPREVVTPSGDRIHTALFKEERAGAVRVTAAGIDGDGWGSPEVHGLPDQALCIYPATHWSELREALKDERGEGSPRTLVEGAFGENLAVEGLGEDAVRIGSVWRWGDVRMQVTMPRAPCATLTRVHGLPTLARVVSASGRTGWYCRVLQGGTASPGDPLILESADSGAPTVAAAWRVKTGKDGAPDC